MRKFFSPTLIVFVTVMLSLLGCQQTPTPLPTHAPVATATATASSTPTFMPTQTSVVATVEVTRQYVVMVTTPVFEVPFGSAYIHQNQYEGVPGQTIPKVLTLVNLSATQFAITGYLCATPDKPQGIGAIGIDGSITPNTNQDFDLNIFDQAPHETCSDVIRITLNTNDKDAQYLAIPITVVVK